MPLGWFAFPLAFAFSFAFAPREGLDTKHPTPVGGRESLDCMLGWSKLRCSCASETGKTLALLWNGRIGIWDGICRSKSSNASCCCINGRKSSLRRIDAMSDVVAIAGGFWSLVFDDGWPNTVVSLWGLATPVAAVWGPILPLSPVSPVATPVK